MELITAKQLQEKLNVSRSTVYRWRKEGMPHKKIGHKTIRYDLDKVMEWLEDKETGEGG